MLHMKVLALILVAMGLAKEAFAESTSSKIPRIGVLVPLTGAFARYGERVRHGVLSAAVQQDQLVFEDEGCAPKSALTAFNFLTSNQEIRFFLGPMCGAPQVVVAPLLERTKSIAVLGNSAPRRVFADSNGRMLSSQPSIEDESAFNGAALGRLGVTRVVEILYDSDFSRTHDAAFKKSFAGSILDTLVHSGSDQNEIRTFALRVKQLRPDALYVPDGYPFILGLMKELQRVGLQSLPVFSVYAAQSADILEASGAAAENIIYSYPDIGKNDALEYFPKIAATMLLKATEACRDNIDCALRKLRADNDFDQYGALKGNFVLKTIRAGNFVTFDEREWQARQVNK